LYCCWQAWLLDSNPGLLNLLLDKKIGISIKMILNKLKNLK